jgi:hypothetical protein
MGVGDGDPTAELATDQRSRVSRAERAREGGTDFMRFLFSASTMVIPIDHRWPLQRHKCKRLRVGSSQVREMMEIAGTGGIVVQ